MPIFDDSFLDGSKTYLERLAEMVNAIDDIAYLCDEAGDQTPARKFKLPLYLVSNRLRSVCQDMKMELDNLGLGNL